MSLCVAHIRILLAGVVLSVCKQKTRDQIAVERHVDVFKHYAEFVRLVVVRPATAKDSDTGSGPVVATTGYVSAFATAADSDTGATSVVVATGYGSGSAIVDDGDTGAALTETTIAAAPPPGSLSLEPSLSIGPMEDREGEGSPGGGAAAGTIA